MNTRNKGRLLAIYLLSWSGAINPLSVHYESNATPILDIPLGIERLIYIATTIIMTTVFVYKVYHKMKGDN